MASATVGVAAEQPRALPGVQAFAPDLGDAVDVGLRGGPDGDAPRPRCAGSSAATTAARKSPNASRPRSSGNGRAPCGRRDTSRRCGHTSCRYSAIASVSHTVTPSCTRHGTRIDDARSSSSARVLGSSDATTCLLEVQPGQPGEQEAAQRPRRVVLAADQERRHVASLHRPVHAAPQYNARTCPHDNRMNATSAGR